MKLKQQGFSKKTRFAMVLSVVLVLLSILFFSGAFGETTINLTLFTNPDLEDGLVGHWTFDGEDMDNGVEDRSGNGNIGTINGQSSTTTEPGRIGQALDFDGSDDYVQIPDSSSLDLSSSFSVAMWVKTSSSANTILLEKSNNNSNYLMHMSASNPGGPIFGITGSDSVDSVTDINDNNWHHVVGVFDDPNNLLAIYIDGILDNSVSEGATLSANSQSLLIGSRSGIGSFPGSLDDVRIYDRALSADEVERLYQLGATTHINTAITSNPTLEDGLIAHWTFDGEDMDNGVEDRAGGNTGTLTNFTSTTTSPGKLGQALEFDGSDDYVIFNSFDSTPSQVTYAYWVYMPDVTQQAFARIIQTGTYAGLPGSGVSHEVNANSNGNDSIKFCHWGGCSGGTGSVDNLELNAWHHVVHVADGDDATIYINGIQHSTFSSTRGTSNAPFIMGAGGGTEFNGKVDDVRIYDRALSSVEVSRLYGLGATTRVNTTITTNPDLESGLVGHWTFDGQDMFDNVSDRSSTGADGSLQGQSSTTTIPGRIGQAIDFDGSDDEVIVPAGDGSTYDFGGSNFTIATWIRSALTTTGHVVSADGITNELYYVELQSDGDIEFVYSTGDIQTITASGSYNDGAWHHIVALRDGARTGRVYVDGMLAASDTDNSGSWGGIEIISDLYFGGNAVGGDQFDGIIDDVRIYNRALSADEVTRLYGLGR